MANEQSGSPLRRWRPFYGAFGAIDDAIEAAGHRRAAFRDVRVRILQLLRGATDDGVAEQLCAALDDAMAESLETLRVVPVPHSTLASTDLAKAVGALGNHGSARIRSLAGDVVRGWTVTIDGGATAVKEELDKLSAGTAEVHKEKLHIPVPPVKMLPAAAATTVEVHKKKLHIPAEKMVPTATATNEEHKKKFVPPPKMLLTAATVSGRQNTSEAKKPVVAESEKMEAKKLVVAQSEKMEAKKPIVAQSEKMEANKKPAIAENEKMETTKRKLREGYQEAERMKRQHTIQKINDKDAAKMFEQKQRKMHRGPARCRTSSGVRRSLLPSLQLI